MPQGIDVDLANEILDHIFGGGDYTREATVYAALLTTLPSSDGSGAVEATGGGYARQSVTNNSTNFPASSGGIKSNGAAITWSAFTAALGTIVGVAIYDASTAGNLMCWAELSSSVYVDNGQGFTIPVSGLSFTLQSEGA